MLLPLALLGYLIGSIPFAFLVASQLAGADLRRRGSRNVGAANVFRTSGPPLALLAAILDLVKGSAAVLAARGLGADDLGATISAVAAVVGHVYPVWLGFHGGKGVATACGAFGVLAPLATSLAAVAFAVTLGLTRYVSLASVTAVGLVAPLIYLTPAPPSVVAGAVATAGLVVFRHRSNLARLLSGTETRLGHRA